MVPAFSFERVGVLLRQRRYSVLLTRDVWVKDTPPLTYTGLFTPVRTHAKPSVIRVALGASAYQHGIRPRSPLRSSRDLTQAWSLSLLMDGCF